MGEPLLNMGLWQLFSSSVHSSCVCQHSGCVNLHSSYVRCVIGGTPAKHGVLKVFFPVVSTVVVSAHIVVVWAHIVFMYDDVMKGEPLVKMGLWKLSSGSVHRCWVLYPQYFEVDYYTLYLRVSTQSIGLWKLFYCSIYSTCVCPQSDCVSLHSVHVWCVIVVTRDNHGALKVVYQ